MKSLQTRTPALTILVILLSVCGTVFVSGQGGTGRDAPPPPPKKATTTKKAPARKTTPSTTRTPANNSTPSFRPQNPSVELVRIPPGSFMMGSTIGDKDERPVHQVTINYSFYMSKYEVTQAQWQAVMGDNPSYFKDCANCPVEQVSWDDTQKFIQRLNGMNDGYTYRLPTEAEWEYACRAGTTGEYPGNLSEMGWCSDNSENKTHAVGSKRLNEWGFADLHGNVWEWCEDWYHENYYGAPIDGSAWLNGGEMKYRVVRGGSWSRSFDYFLSANRAHSYPVERTKDTGFRVVAVR